MSGEARYAALQDILRPLGRVAVAYSGGIDSTVLLHAACETLGAGNVVALLGVSCLLPGGTLEAAANIFARHFQGKALLQRVALDPLGWDGFIANTPERCYCCKKNVYLIFLDEMQKAGMRFLLDGSHVDDLKGERPGSRAIVELGVRTPLREAGYGKDQIRQHAKAVGLMNHDLPSNSCLATRIAVGLPISKERLEVIDAAERILQNDHFRGCRVRLEQERTIIAVAENDMAKIVCGATKHRILASFRELGLPTVALDLNGR